MSAKPQLKRRLIIGFGAIMVLATLTTAYSISQVSYVESALKEINDLNSVKQRYAINFRGSVHDRAISLRDVVLVSDPAEREVALNDIKRLEEAYARSAQPLDMFFADDAVVTPDKTILSEIKAIEARTNPLVKEVIDAQLGGRSEEARQLLLQKARPAFVEWLAAINKFINFEEAQNKAIGNDVYSVVGRFALAMSLACIMTLLIAGGVAFWNVRALRPIRYLTEVMTKLAEGDLDVAVQWSRAKMRLPKLPAQLSYSRTTP